MPKKLNENQIKSLSMMVVDSTSDLISITDFSLNVRYIYINQAFKKVLGYTDSDLIGKSGFDLLHPEDRRKLLPLLRKYLKIKLKISFAKEKNYTEKVSYRLKNKKGKWVYLESTINIVNKNLLFISKDLTEKKMEEEKIKQHNEFLKKIIDSLPYPFYVINPRDYSIELFNQAAADILLSRNQSDNLKFCYQLDHQKNFPCSGKDHPCPLKKVLKEKKAQTMEHVHYKKNGAVMKVQVSAFPVFNKEGEIEKIIEYSIDISEQKAAQTKLIASEEKFKAIFYRAQDAIFIKDLKGKYLELNARAEVFFNKSASSIIGKTDAQIFKSSEAQTEEEDKRVISGEIVQNEVFRKNGKEKRYYHITKVPIRGSSGKIDKICVFAHDITMIKRVEEELRNQKEKIDMYLNTANVMMLALDKKGNVSMVNKKVLEILGLDSKVDIIGKNWFKNFIPAKNIIKTKKVYNSLIKGDIKGKEYNENFIKRKDGQERLVAWKNTILRDVHGKIIGTLSSGEDISERRKKDEEIKNSAKEWSNIFNSMADGVSLHSTEFKILKVNKSLLKLLAKDKNEVIGQKCYKIFHTTKKPISACPLAQTLKTGKETSVEIYEPTISKWLSVYTSPIFNSNGEINKIIHVVRDITERKQAAEEIEKRSEELKKFNDLMVGRELKMIELKNKIKELQEKIN